MGILVQKRTNAGGRHFFNVAMVNEINFDLQRERDRDREEEREEKIHHFLINFFNRVWFHTAAIFSTPQYILCLMLCVGSLTIVLILC